MSTARSVKKGQTPHAGAERAIIRAAVAWASAERELRNRCNYPAFPNTRASGEEAHRIVLFSDYTEQRLLELVETYMLNGPDDE